MLDAGVGAGQVQVHLYAAARAAVGSSVVTTPPGTLAGILRGLSADFPEFGSVWPRCSFLVDEVAVHGDVAEIQVDSGSRIDVLPPFAGG
ncbi:MAG: MoaD/ThiS family protein [Actinomycetales bacterium]